MIFFIHYCVFEENWGKEESFSCVFLKINTIVTMLRILSDKIFKNSRIVPNRDPSENLNDN